MNQWLTEDESVGQEPTPTAFTWATVTQASPLRVRLDGLVDPQPTTPQSLVASGLLTVGKRVWVQVYGKRLIIIGVNGGV